MADLFDKCKTAEGYFGQFRAMGDNYYTRPTLDSLPGTRMDFMGKEQIMWSVNNYLGLAQNEEIKEIAKTAISTHSISAPMGSRMMSGTTTDHLEFEKKLAAFAQKEAAMVFNYGYLGVLGTISSLVGQDDIIIMDKLAHASIVDGVFLSRAPFRVFKHNDMNSLEIVLKRVNRERKGGVLIVAEGTYGMTGDLAKLPEMCELKEKYDARIFIDDAHGVGTLGEMGRGTADHFGVQDKIDIYFGTFAKSFASIGGFSASDKDVIDWILFNARTQVFAKSLPMVYVRTLTRTLDMIMNGDDLRKKMRDNSNKLKNGLRDLGFYVGEGESPICAVFTPLEDRVLEEIGGKMITYLREKGVFVTGILYPVIPLGLFMFRMIPTAAHSDEEIETTIKVFKEMRDDLKLDPSMKGEDLASIRKIYG